MTTRRLDKGIECEYSFQTEQIEKNLYKVNYSIEHTLKSNYIY